MIDFALFHRFDILPISACAIFCFSVSYGQLPVKLVIPRLREIMHSERGGPAGAPQSAGRTRRKLPFSFITRNAKGSLSSSEACRRYKLSSSSFMSSTSTKW